MPELLQNISGYSLLNLNRINILLGKNGCGKSTLFQKVEGSLATNKAIYGTTTYITPERGGSLVENVSIEQSVANEPGYLSDARRRNQHNQFKEQSVVNYRLLKELVQDEIETIAAIRNDHSITFDGYLEKINVLLDNIKIVRDKAKRSFTILKKSDNAPIQPNQISSGESELIALGIECLTFIKKIDNLKSNVLFLDEPDVHLHPDLQSRLILFLSKLIAESPHFQLFIATHSTAILGASGENELVSIAFMKSGDMDITFQKISDYHRKVLPVFGAHPLSEIFNTRPIILVEGEDDVRIWQQAVRTSQGRLKLYPVSTDTIVVMNEYELEVQKIIASVYDTAKAYSLRDRDDDPEAIEDLDKIVRFRLSCRNAESLILSNEVLTNLGTDWATMQHRITEWIDDPVNNAHEDRATFVAFRDGGYLRKTFNLKEVRNVLVYLSRSRKPWEVACGQAIGNLTWNNESNFASDGSLINFLGEKLVRNVIPKGAIPE